MKKFIHGIILGVASQEILGEIFFKDVADARNLFIGSSEFKRMLNGCFLVARAQEIFGGNLFKDVASQEIF